MNDQLQQQIDSAIENAEKTKTLADETVKVTDRMTSTKKAKENVNDAS